MNPSEDIAVEFRAMSSLPQAVKDALTQLMEGHRPNQRELFRQWLRHPVAGMYAAIVRAQGDLLGFAAASLHDSWRMGMVGVYVHPTFRGQGLARRALDTLLANIRFVVADRPEYLYYEEGKERLFRIHIERHGFKDLFLHQQEYSERYRKATNIPSTT